LQDLKELVHSVLAETGLQPEGLGLEITESVLTDDIESAMDTSQALNGMGVKLVVDDFGIGYSSFSRLKSFPVKALKIDRSFVRDITSDPNALAIVSAIIATAHNLQIRVVAEGVETPQQLSLLEARGCDEVQGFYLGKPAAAAAATQILKHGFEEGTRANH
jgi:EAL domain-containing protein (putative c-di-GMP-specific phosphodiesterase class I)